MMLARLPQTSGAQPLFSPVRVQTLTVNMLTTNAMLARLAEKLLPFLNEPVNGIEANAHVDSDALEIVAAAMPILKWVVDIPTMDVRTAIVMGHDVREHFPLIFLKRV